MSTSPTSPMSFAGVSKYTSDFQAILTRAVRIAQIPITALQNKDSDVLQKKTILATLNSAVSDLAASLSSLGKVGATQALTASSSNPARVTAINTGATAPATHTINTITSVATAASERTTASFVDSVATPVSSTGSMSLMLGATSYALELTNNSLVGLRDRINGLDAGVTASILTTGSGNYLSISANTTGSNTLKLVDDPVTDLNPGGANTNVLTHTVTTVTGLTTTGLPDTNSTHVSAAGNLTLTVGLQDYAITLTDNSLQGLRDQINASGADVTASIVTNDQGNFLSVATNTPGVTTLHLNDDPGGANTSLLTNTDQQGTNAVFKLDGIGISQAGNVVNSVVPGLTFTIAATATSATTLTLATDPTQLSSTLQDFVAKYNTLRVQLNAQVGPAAGLLSGDLAVGQLQGQLRQMNSYRSTSGSIRSLTELGIEFSSAGEASFNQGTFNNLTSTQVSDGFKFLGSATTGLGKFSASFTQFSDPIAGWFKIEQDGFDRTDRSLQNQIATLTDRITLMQNSLTLRLEAADAFEASLQSQQQILTASLVGLSLVLYGKNVSLNA